MVVAITILAALLTIVWTTIQLLDRFHSDRK